MMNGKSCLNRTCTGARLRYPGSAVVQHIRIHALLTEDAGRLSRKASLADLGSPPLMLPASTL